MGDIGCIDARLDTVLFVALVGCTDRRRELPRFDDDDWVWRCLGRVGGDDIACREYGPGLGDAIRSRNDRFLDREGNGVVHLASAIGDEETSGTSDCLSGIFETLGDFRCGGGTFA